MSREIRGEGRFRFAYDHIRCKPQIVPKELELSRSFGNKSQFVSPGTTGLLPRLLNREACVPGWAKFQIVCEIPPFHQQRLHTPFARQVLSIRSEPRPPQPPQIFLRLPHIPPNLLFQRLDRRKLDLIAEAIEEVNLNFGFR